MEFKLEQFSGDQIYAGRQLFKTPAEFVLGVARLPKPQTHRDEPSS